MTLDPNPGASPGDASSKRSRILVVDDDEGVRRAIIRALERDGLEVESASTGEAGLAAFDTRMPEAVLLDVQMPGATGFEICEAMRRRPGGAEVPIVIMTGDDDEESIRQAYDVGATDFLTKPIQPLILQHRVRYLRRAGRTLEALRQSEARLAGAQHLANMGSWQMDLVTREIFLSDAFVEILGLPAGATPSVAALAERLLRSDRERLGQAVEQCRETGEPVPVDCNIVQPGGEARALQCQLRMTVDAEGNPAVLEGIAIDVTEQRAAAQRVHRMAFYDELTGLANRKLFEERLAEELAEAERTNGAVALLAIDVDHFKRINDTLGLDAGDDLLRTVGDRLGRLARMPAALDATLADALAARLGSDEFTLMLPTMGNPQTLDAITRLISRTLGTPVTLGDHEISPAISIGIAVFPSDGTDVATLMRNADAALSHAKAQGRANHQFYAERLNSVGLKRLIIESKLRRAIEQDEFELYYQPKLDLQAQRIVGFEALLRWFDADLGSVPPSEAIPIAEETGLIGPLGDWVLQAAARQAVAWRNAGVCGVPIAVNLSPAQFRREDMAEHLLSVIACAGAEPAWIGIEITESSVLQNEGRAVRQLEAFRRHGIKVSLDDFGTGYSSLSHLRTLPVDAVKIDRSFVMELGTDDDAAALAATIVRMGEALGLRVIAEGVEEPRQRDLLKGWGCHEMQGYLFSPPLPADETEALWRELATDD